MKQLEFKKVKGWGGKRRGAGRPNRTGLVSHGKRPPVDFKKPIHLTIRLKDGMAGLRNKPMVKQFKKAVAAATGFGLHVIHYSLQDNHIHLIAEAKDNAALSSGTKSLIGRLGKYIRGVTGGRGAAIAGRFHIHVLKTPTEMKRALEYVLLNTAKHKKSIEYKDEFSSGYSFPHWRELLGTRFRGFIEHQGNYTDQGLSPPRSWLAKVGWMRAPA